MSDAHEILILIILILQDNVHTAVIMIVLAKVHLDHLMNRRQHQVAANPQTTPSKLLMQNFHDNSETKQSVD